MGSIYVLKDPDTQEIRYCGQTKLPLKERLRFHLGNVMRGQKRSPASMWVGDLIDLGKIPIIEEVVSCEEADLYRLEIAWIAKLRADGHPLLNKSKGGPRSSGYDADTETRRARAISAAKSWSTPDIRAKMMEGICAAQGSDEVKAKHSATKTAAWSDPNSAYRKMTATQEWRDRMVRMLHKRWHNDTRQLELI